MFRFVALAFAMTVLPAWSAAAVPVVQGAESLTWRGVTPFVTLVQQDDIPDVVMMLARRAVRAERRGDMETANELYETIRELGYRVQRPGEQRGGDRSSGNRNQGGWFGAGDQDRSGSGDDDRDDDDDDDRDDDDRDDRDGDSDRGDSDGGDSDGGDSDGGDSDGGGDD